MTPDDRIKLVSELLDLPLMDSDGEYCGIVDDIEFSGSVGKDLRPAALLVGPGAYAGRLPAWAMWLVRSLFGDHVGRVPLEKVRTIGAVVHLDCSGKSLGLQKSEARASKWVPQGGAL